MLDIIKMQKRVNKGRGLCSKDAKQLLNLLNNNWLTDTSILEHNQQVWICFSWKFAPTDYHYGYAVWDKHENEFFFDIDDADLLTRKKAFELGYKKEDIAGIKAFMLMPNYYRG